MTVDGAAGRPKDSFTELTFFSLQTLVLHMFQTQI
jgi:hypothetical protein